MIANIHVRVAVANLLDDHVAPPVVAVVVGVDEPLHAPSDHYAQAQALRPVDGRLVVELPERRIAVAAAVDVELPEVREGSTPWSSGSRRAEPPVSSTRACRCVARSSALAPATRCAAARPARSPPCSVGLRSPRHGLCPASATVNRASRNAHPAATARLPITVANCLCFLCRGRRSNPAGARLT